MDGTLSLYWDIEAHEKQYIYDTFYDVIKATCQ